MTMNEIHFLPAHAGVRLTAISDPQPLTGDSEGSKLVCRRDVNHGSSHRSFVSSHLRRHGDLPVPDKELCAFW
ncbi:hypothetical protein M3J09_000648 [Ascochyta lentis]